MLGKGQKLIQLLNKQKQSKFYFQTLQKQNQLIKQQYLNNKQSNSVGEIPLNQYQQNFNNNNTYSLNTLKFLSSNDIIKHQFSTTKKKTSQKSSKKTKKSAQKTLDELYDQGYEHDNNTVLAAKQDQNDIKNFDQDENFEEYRQLLMEFDIIESEGGESQLYEEGVLMSQKEIESGGESDLSDYNEPSEQFMQSQGEISQQNSKKTKKKKSSKTDLKKEKLDFKLSKDQNKNNLNTMKFVDKAKQSLSNKTLNKFIMLTELYKDRVRNNNYQIHLSIYSTNYIMQVSKIFAKEGADHLIPYFLKSQVNEIHQELFQNRTVQDFEIQNENYRTKNVYKQLENSVPHINQQSMSTLDSLCTNKNKKQSEINNNNSNISNYQQINQQQQQKQDTQFQKIQYNNNNQQNVIDNEIYEMMHDQEFLKYQQEMLQQQNQFQNSQVNNNNNENGIRGNIRDENLFQEMMQDREFLNFYSQQGLDFNQNINNEETNYMQEMENESEQIKLKTQQKRNQIIEKNNQLDQQALNMVNQQYFSTQKQKNTNDELNNFNNIINNIDNNIENNNNIENMDGNELLQLDVDENNQQVGNNQKNDEYIFFDNEMTNYKNSELIENNQEDYENQIVHNQEDVLNLEAFYKEMDERENQSKTKKYNISIDEIINQDKTNKINKIHSKKQEINKMQIQKNDENIILYQKNFYTRKPEKTNLVYSFGYEYNVNKQNDIEKDIQECIGHGFGKVKIVKMFNYRDFNPAYGLSLEKREKQAKQALQLDENLSIQEQLKTGQKPKKQKKMVSIVESVQETDESRQERKTKIMLNQLEKSKSNQYNKSYCILEMENYFQKQQILGDDMRLFGMKIGLNNQIKFEDADYKTSVIVKNLPYGSTIQDFVKFFNNLCKEQELDHLCIACEKEEQYKRITKEYLILRLKNAQQSYEVIDLLDKQKFEKNTLKINHTYGNLIPEDPYKGVLSSEEMYRMEQEENNAEEIVYRENFEKPGKEFLKKKVEDHHQLINQQIKEEETVQDQFYEKQDMHQMFYSLQVNNLEQNENIFSFDISEDEEHEEYTMLSQEEKDWFDE